MVGIVATRDAVGQNAFPGQSMHLPDTFDDKSSNRETPYFVSELPGNSRRERGSALKVLTTIVLISAIVVCVVAMLLGFGEQAKCDGSFDLALKLQLNPAIAESSVYFATSWMPKGLGASNRKIAVP